MRRAVLDPGVLVSALITPAGTPAKLLAEVRADELELIASPLLLAELEGVLRREKFRRYVDLDAVGDYLERYGYAPSAHADYLALFGDARRVDAAGRARMLTT